MKGGKGLYIGVGKRVEYAYAVRKPRGSLRQWCGSENRKCGNANKEVRQPLQRAAATAPFTAAAAGSPLAAAKRQWAAARCRTAACGCRTEAGEPWQPPLLLVAVLGCFGLVLARFVDFSLILLLDLGCEF